uniref:nitric oxide dioxygenase n=1 Tax=Cyanothece sp. (strain PCC 7425 / ATCC 29141) TaxID=395961 RepID=B8HK01_CYAP4
MLESLGKIQNPWVRSLTAAVTLGSAVTLGAAIAIGVSHPPNRIAYKNGVYALLLGTGGGAILGLLYPVKKQRRSPQPGHSAEEKGSAIQNGQGWRNFVVFRKVKESEEITSFYLKPEDKGELISFQPGQFLTIKLDISGQSKPVIRTYSLSDYAQPCEYYRLSIKREPAPKNLDVPPGLASNFMHDQVQVGTVIPAKPPSGKFVLNRQSANPVVLLSNGVGITPMISMAKACSQLNPQRSIWFLHGARDGRFHAFREEVEAIAQTNPNVRVHYAYSSPRPADAGSYHSQGYVDTALVQPLVDKDAEFYLCGSPPFLRSLIDGLREWGVPDERIVYESFGQAMKIIPEPSPMEAVSAQQGVVAEITFAKSGQTLSWQEREGSILEFAEANGLKPDYSCRQGICGTCSCSLREGEVTYVQPPTAEIPAGSVLICIAKPKTASLVLDL